MLGLCWQLGSAAFMEPAGDDHLGYRDSDLDHLDIRNNDYFGVTLSPSMLGLTLSVGYRNRRRDRRAREYLSLH